MKFIISRAVLVESQVVGQQICETFGVSYKDMSVDEQMAILQASTEKLVNVRFDVVGDELHYFIDDKVVIVILRVYVKFARYARAIFDIAKPLLGALQSDVEEITALVSKERS